MIKLLKQNVPFAQNKRADKKDTFNSNNKISISSSTKVYALNHALLIYYEAEGNKLLLRKQRQKNHHVRKKKKEKGIKQAVEFDEQWEWRKSLWLWELGSKSYSTKDREQKQHLKPSRKNRHPKRAWA